MTIDGYTLRFATDEDFAASILLMQEVFQESLEPDVVALEQAVYEPARTLLAISPDGDLAGQVAAFTRDLTVPGGVVPAAHVTAVGVGPTHRRRGLLRRMIVQQFSDIAALGESVAVLWASEGRIYQRFGYGLAAFRASMEIDHEVAVNQPVPAEPGRLRAIPIADAAPALKGVYEQVRLASPGYSSRTDAWWGKALADAPSQRSGDTPMRVITHIGPDGVDGYATWRVKPDWNHSAMSQVVIRELVAANPVAYQALFRFLLDIDLTRSVRMIFGRVDEPIMQMVNEPRRLVAKLFDALWVRLVDVPAALTARRYLAPVDVVLAVTDQVVPANNRSFHLVADADPATCTPTDRPADLRLDVSALGAAYLGGTTLTQLAASGRVEELRPGTLLPASLAFRWHVQPAATDTF